ncbi:MAG: hypothetical protein V4481_03515 [Patescibacteria group bacterium]
MPLDEEKSKIEGLKEGLYSRNSPDVRTHRKLRFTDSTSTVKTSWEEPAEQSDAPKNLNIAYQDHSMSFLTKVLIGSAIFCALALATGAFLFFQGGNLISANNIDISVSGPVSIPGGEEVSFDVRVSNNNNVDLQLTDLEIDFPEGTINPANPSQEMKTYRELLGDIRSGASVQKTVKAIVFGEENIQKEIVFNVTYKVKGSTSLFTKNKTYDILINSSPIIMKATSFDEVTSGQEFDITVDLKSNSQQVLKNVLLKSQYPFGYTFNSSNIGALAGNTTWKIGDIPPGGERKVVIRGNLKGENTDMRVFRFSAGTQSSTDAKAIGTEYMTTERRIAIEKPFISATIAIDNDETTADFPAKPGEQKRVKLNWSNNLSSAVGNVEIIAKLSGSAFDRAQVFPEGGYYQSSENQIVWNRQTNPELATVGAGESGSVSFSLMPKDTRASASPITNPLVNITANVSGNRTSEGSVPEVVKVAATRNIRLASGVSLSGRVVRSSGPFVNTGPIPPKVDKASTYTIFWTVDNTSNPVSNAKVTATLPPNVKWVNAINPAAEDISYDKNTSTITWNIGQVSTYTRSGSRTKEVAFQVSLEPNLPQAGEAVTLVTQAILTASDDFAGVLLGDKQDPLTTRFSTDPSFKQGDEVVGR